MEEVLGSLYFRRSLEPTFLYRELSLLKPWFHYMAPTLT